MAMAEPLPEAARGEDEILVDRFREGDARAFEELVRRHQRAVFHLARRFVRDDDEAKDVAQRAFVKAYQGVHALRGGAAFRTWLFRITANLALNHIRDNRRVLASEDAGVNVPIEAIGAGRIDDAQRRAQLIRALDELPPKQRLVLELRVFEELPFREVAHIAGCTENAAKVNFHHAVKRLRAHIIETGAGERGEGGDQP
jgi:RNA polymerase sigma-70 factor (ECF subfamily)